jgi:hypothetical protein
MVTLWFGNILKNNLLFISLNMILVCLGKFTHTALYPIGTMNRLTHMKLWTRYETNDWGCSPPA